MNSDNSKKEIGGIVKRFCRFNGKKTRILSFLFGAFLLILAFPPFSTGIFAYVALVPLFVATEGLDFRKAFLRGFLFGFIWIIGVLYWIIFHATLSLVAGIFALFGMVFILAGFFALKIAIVRWSEIRLGKRVLWLLPLVWAAVEYGRSFDQLSFPWVAIGNTQTYYTGLIQFADLVSVYGVSAWIVLINLIVYQLIKLLGMVRSDKKTIIKYTGFLLLAFILPYFYSQWVLHREIEGKKIKLALCQGNIGIETKWARNKLEFNFRTYEELSQLAARADVDLIVWPETATPTYLLQNNRYKHRIQSFVDTLGIPILTGTPYNIAESEEYAHNSAAFFRPGETEVKVYHKINPVPFGERVPLDNYIKILEAINFGEADFKAGTEFTVFPLGNEKFSTIICFESIFPDLVHKFIARGAELILVITNDVWFGDSASPYQHARIGTMRAVENKVPVVRCANTGISMIIDPFGKVKQSLAFNRRGVIIDEVLLRKSDTFYGKYGNVFSKGCLIVLVILLVSAFRKRKYLDRTT